MNIIEKMLIFELASELNEITGYKVSIKAGSGVQIFYSLNDVSDGLGLSPEQLKRLSKIANSSVKIETRDSKILTV